ncbi:hypothetical protein [Burkholderia thailandensis]|uniref:hypothetical protein n=1 Tax=Burkholderia thailandensis TaxID=57975 RepID=UPI00298FF29C|nr:hypothetical protein [Burkholderia thailandensis]
MDAVAGFRVFQVIARLGLAGDDAPAGACEIPVAPDPVFDPHARGAAEIRFLGRSVHHGPFEQASVRFAAVLADREPDRVVVRNRVTHVPADVVQVMHAVALDDRRRHRSAVVEGAQRAGRQHRIGFHVEDLRRVARAHVEPRDPAAVVGVAAAEEQAQRVALQAGGGRNLRMRCRPRQPRIDRVDESAFFPVNTRHLGCPRT